MKSKQTFTPVRSTPLYNSPLLYTVYIKKETCARLLQTVQASETLENAINETTTTQAQPVNSESDFSITAAVGAIAT